VKILILSNTAWNINNSFGNSFSNIFKGFNNIEIANIYCRYGIPNNKIVNDHFQITEKSLIKNLINKSYSPGKVIKKIEKVDDLNDSEEKIFNFTRTKRLQIFFWIRDIIWKIGRWKSPELRNFIDEFNPDIIFQPLYYSNYLNDIVLFIKKYTDVPMVCYVSDDVYTLKQFSLSPLFWIDRLIKRKKIRKVINKCEHIYTISEIQKQEYEKIFNKKCKILTKGKKFSESKFKNKFEFPLKMVYTGNVGNGRWKSLESIGKQIKKINRDETKIQLYIYSLTPMTKKMKNAMNIENSSYFMGGISPEKVNEVQKNADILVHVEPTDFKGKLRVRHSFSTKIIDYFESCRPIFAVGTSDMASINHLIKNNSAIVAENEDEIYTSLKNIIDDRSLLNEYAKNAWECGKKYHQIDKIQEQLYEDLLLLTN